MGQMTAAETLRITMSTVVDTLGIYCNVDKSFMTELANKAVIGEFVQAKEGIGARKTLELDSSTADSSCMESVVSRSKC
jgi:hypothetical protein